MKRFNPNAYGNPIAKERSKVLSPSAISADHARRAEEKRDSRTRDTSFSKQQTNCKDKEDSTITDHLAHVNAEDSRLCSKAMDGLSSSRYAPKTAESCQHNVNTAVKSADQNVKGTSTVTQASGSSNISKVVIPQEPIKSVPFTATSSSATMNHSSMKTMENLTKPSLQATPSILQEKTDNVVVSAPGTKLPKHTRINTMTPVDNSSQAANPRDFSSGQALTSDMLSMAQNEQFKRIQLRIRAKDKKDATTSLRDLDIARMPVSKPASLAQATTPAPVSESHSNDQSNIDIASAATQAQAKSMHERPISSITDHVRQNASQDKNSQGLSQPKSRTGHRKADQENLLQTSLSKKVNQSNWAPRSDLRPVEMDFESNAGGSSMPSNASQASNDSIRPLHAGRALHGKQIGRPHPLQGWDGTMQPPPADWNDRPRFYNDDPEFRDDLARWNQDVCHMTIEADEHKFTAIPHAELSRMDMNPDGIGMVRRDTTIDKSNAARYGYHGIDAEEAIRYAQPIKRDDFKDWGKLDVSRPENSTIRTETTNDLVTNWVQHTEERRRLAYAQTEAQEQSAQSPPHHKSAPNPNKPILNIYLRPACGIDISHMTEIYNWYIENSPRTAETAPIGEEDMQQRLDDVRHGKLPFIVAIERNLASATPYDLKAEAEASRQDPHPIRNIDPMQRGMLAQEKIVGWASAQDFTAIDFVERISVELEIYVDPAYRQLGIGKCLMDKLMEACDRGYMKRGGYQFHCPLEHKHLYNAGGGRDLHKLMFVLRKWRYPKDAVPPAVVRKHQKANPKRKDDDQENDYEVWLKKWLESWNFEVEGVLKGAGAKNGRFVDLVHLSRETRWQPTEGRIPDPMPGY